MPIISSLLPEISKAIDRGVKIKLLGSHRFTALSSMLSLLGEDSFGKFKKGIEIRLVQNFNSCFGIVDDSIVVLFQLHPLDNDRVLSVVKIWDAGLAKKIWVRNSNSSGMREKSLILKKLLKGKFSVVKDQNIFTDLK